MRLSLAALVLLCTALSAQAAALDSTHGGIDCGHAGGQPLNGKCVTHPCKTSADCKDPKAGEAPGSSAPGGLPYGCLADVHVCGWLNPDHFQDLKGN